MRVAPHLVLRCNLPDMLKDIIKIKLRLLYLEGGERLSRHFTRSIFSIATFSVFAYLVFTIVKLMTAYMLAQEKIGLFLYHRLLSLALFVFFAIISVANILVAFATVFRNTEAEFLHTLPIKPVEIFTAKFFDSFLYSSALMLILIISAVAGYASYFKNWPAVLIGIPLVILPMILSAACIGAITLLITLKLSNKIPIKVATVFVTLLYAGSTYSYIVLNNPFRLFTDVMRYYPHIDKYLGVLDPKPDYLAPSFWAGNFFYFTSTHNFLGSAASLIIVCATAGILFIVMTKLASKFYEETFWIARQKLFTRKLTVLYGKRNDASMKYKPISLLKRDFLLFVREPSQTFHFAVLIILIAIFLFNLFAMRIYLSDAFIITSAFTLIYAFNNFLVVSLAIRFVYPMISLEGQSFWLIRSSPVMLKEVFYTKLLPSIIFLSLVGTALGYAALSPFARFHDLIPTSMAFGFIGGIIFPSLTMIFGGAFADYKEKNPVRISSSHGATLSLVVSLGIMVILSSIVFNRTFRYFSSAGPLQDELWGIAILSLMAAVSVMLARYFGMRALKTDFY
jgi:ABC-2 type transport system permease protein